MPYDPIVDYNDIRWDERGSPFWMTASGKRHFLPPIIAGQYRDNPRLLQWAQSQGVTAEKPSGNVPGGSFLRGRGEWNTDEGQYDRPLNVGNLASLGIGGAIAAPFLLPALGIGGGGSAAAAAPAASGSLTEGLMSAVPASIASQGASAAVPLGGVAAGTGAGAGAATGSALAAGSGLDRLKNALMSPQGIGTAASIASLLASGDGTSDQTRALEQQAARNAAITEARMRRTDPLHEAAVQLAFGRLPVSSRNGITLTRVPLPG